MKPHSICTNPLIIAFLATFALGGGAFARDVDLSRLPVGDGKISSRPKVGWLWACRTDPDVGGAQAPGPWFNGDGTFDLTAKVTVPGDVKWDRRLTIERHADRRVFSMNALPDHGTGIYPIPPDSEAYRYDRNPNRIRQQSMQFDLPADPLQGDAAGCAPGAVGMLLSGAVLFNALDAPGRDAVAWETQDKCQGHPQPAGVYHYHSMTSCIDTGSLADGHSALVGYAIDGFGIFGHQGVGGETLATADLDACHGHTHAIPWDGKVVEMYHYHATWDFPYSVGCLRGSYSREHVGMISGMQGPRAERQGGRDGHPDLATAAVRLGLSEAALRRALGAPPPNLARAARKLGISEGQLRTALGVR